MPTICMIGNRGHNSYVLGGLGAMPDCRLEGICPAGDDIGNLLAWCEQHDRKPSVYDDYRTMLDTVKPDAASVCGPFEEHAAMCIECFRRGIAVFAEKPVALSLTELAALETAHAEANVHFAAMMGMRYEAPFLTAWRAVRGGAVGSIRMLNARKSYKLGTRPEYYRQRDTYGGTIPWVGSHAIDLIHWFSGESFAAVRAAQSARGNREHGTLEVSALCQFVMSNEVLASASVDFLRPGNAPTHGDDRIRVAGTEGVLEVRGGEVYLINAEEPGERKLPLEADCEIFVDFLTQATGGAPAMLSAADSFAVARAYLLAQQSADEGVEIRFA